MKQRTLKDPKRLFHILKELKPSSSTILAFLLFTERPFNPFKLTYWDISQMTGIKNPYLAMKDLLSKGYLKKCIVDRNECEWTILVDLVE